MASFRIVSYNLLVPAYADPTQYDKCDPTFLKTEYRWNLIKSQLENQIVLHKYTIICLQEVSITMLPELNRFFHQAKYSFFYNLYGAPKSDFMGIGLAIPKDLTLQSISYINIGEYLSSFSTHEKDEVKPKQHGYIQSLMDYFFPKAVEFKSMSPWTGAVERRNVLIFIQVLIENKKLCIGNYHMPCAYREPDLMYLHSSAVKEMMFNLSDGEDFVLTGDFNLVPSSNLYQCLLNSNEDHFQHLFGSDCPSSYRPTMNRSLKSAYLVANGREPKYTNFADREHTGLFCETLDYIFYSGKLVVDDVLQLPNEPTSASYPDEFNPSDHLMIAASLHW